MCETICGSIRGHLVLKPAAAPCLWTADALLIPASGHRPHRAKSPSGGKSSHEAPPSRAGRVADLPCRTCSVTMTFDAFYYFERDCYKHFLPILVSSVCIITLTCLYIVARAVELKRDQFRRKRPMQPLQEVTKVANNAD